MFWVTMSAVLTTALMLNAAESACAAPSSYLSCRNLQSPREVAFFKNRCPAQYKRIDIGLLPAPKSGHVIAVTTLDFTGQSEDDSVTTTMERLREVGAVIKHRNDSIWKVTWQGAVEAINDMTQGAACIFQLRVDDRDAAGNTGGGFASEAGGYAFVGNGYLPAPMLGAASLHTQTQALAVTAVFRNLSAGSHTLSVWTSEPSGWSVDSCFLNPGNLHQQVLVEEVLPEE